MQFDSRSNEASDYGGASKRSSCGVTLTRPGYYTIPPLRELHRYENERGECLVKDFAVGRVGYGSVRFPGPVDVADLNLDEVVSFDLGEVAVYGDEDDAPPVGFGLNRRARVQLEQIWPCRDEGNFEDRLRLLSARQGATFLDYDFDRGTLVIEVEHFSKYTYKDSDGDCEIISDGDKHIQREEFEQLKELEEFRMGKGLGGIRMSEKSTSFVSPSVIASPTHPADVSTFLHEPKPLYIVKSSFFDEDSMSDDMSSCDVGVHLSVQNSSTCTSAISDNVNFNQSDGLIKRYTLLSRVKEPEMQLDDIFDYSSIMADASLFKGRSFKVGWGRGLKLITLSPRVCGTNLMGEPRCVDIVDVATDVLGRPEAVKLEEHLDVVLNSCTFTTSESSLPSCTVKSGWETLVQHQLVARQLLDDCLHDKLVKYYSQTWDLCSALWGPEATTASSKRELFSSWLQTVSKNETVDVSNDRDVILAQIFVHLLSHEVYKACQVAMNHDMPSLSVLIAQTQQSTRYHLATQIEQWQDRGSMNFIAARIKKIYTLLGGLPIVADVNVLEGLKWKRILALYLWYICPPGTLLDEAVKEYGDAFERISIANSPAVEHSSPVSESVYDTQFQMLQLNHRPQHILSRILNPAGHTEHICDYRFSWLLLQVLTSLKIGSLPSSLRDYIHIRFATQLEAMGMWRWSAFVVLFVSEPRLKSDQLVSILERNLDVDPNPEVVNFLVRQLKIPATVIHSVLAQKTKTSGDYIVSFKHYLLSKSWWKAHDVCVAHVVPDLILRGDLELLARFLRELFADTTKGPQSVPAGLVYEFLHLRESLDGIGEEATEDVYRKKQLLMPRVIALITRLKSFPAVEPRQILAKLELARHLKRMLTVVTYDHDDPTIASTYQQLALPFDYEYTMTMRESL